MTPKERETHTKAGMSGEEGVKVAIWQYQQSTVQSKVSPSPQHFVCVTQRETPLVDTTVRSPNKVPVSYRIEQIN